MLFRCFEVTTTTTTTTTTTATATAAAATAVPRNKIQNHENEHVRGIEQGEARHRGLNLAVVKLTTVQVTKLPL
jgi:flagellar hook assembly protein FlgD